MKCCGLLLVLLCLVACTPAGREVLPPPSAGPSTTADTALDLAGASSVRVVGTRIPVTVAIATSPAVAAATLLPPPATAVATPPTLAPAPSAARFANLRFATAPGAPPQSNFPAGTEAVYSIWEYHDMESSDQIRRIWFRDDQIWHVREHSWDVETYGRSGTVQDMRIYDFEGDGLNSARYRLQVYVNDQLQIEAGFVVGP